MIFLNCTSPHLSFSPSPNKKNRDGGVGLHGTPSPSSAHGYHQLFSLHPVSKQLRNHPQLQDGWIRINNALWWTHFLEGALSEKEQ